MEEKVHTMPTKDIVNTAISAGNFKTLAAALGAAELVETLKGKGPFTVFAPKNKQHGPEFCPNALNMRTNLHRRLPKNVADIYIHENKGYRNYN